MSEKMCETADSLKTPAEWCKTGYTPLTIVNIINYNEIIKQGYAKEAFGEYADRVKEIIEKNKCWEGPIGEIGDRPHHRILPDERGFCHFYDDKKNKCMLGDERPRRC